MAEAGLRHTRKLTIIAQDPGLHDEDGLILTTEVEVPAEDVDSGPRGYRVFVIDYDASTDTFYRPFELPVGRDPYRPYYEGDPTPKDKNLYSKRLLEEPTFHAQNVYATIMRILARFEFALGRRVRWSFDGHQLMVAPHAFADANAFYSKEDRALMFGYFRGAKRKPIFTCLAHDVIVHETTHALLDGLRQRYMDPSSPEQAGFHEGFADIVALLSILSLGEIVNKALFMAEQEAGDAEKGGNTLIHEKSVTPEKLKDSALLGLATQMGTELSGVRGHAFRNSVKLEPDPNLIKRPDYEEPHKRGEVLVAAILNAFPHIWVNRIQGLGRTNQGYYYRDRVIEEGAAIADYLLTMCIRAIDYSPPTDLQFCDFLSAILTADAELHADDSRYRFREILLDRFKAYGILPTSKGENGVWEPPTGTLTYEHSHFESLQREPDEVFRFIWQNRTALGLHSDAYTRVISVRPCLRIGPDGFALQETVAEYVQMIDLRARELDELGTRKPEGMPTDQQLRIYGGGALIFDEYCRLKYHVRNKIANPERQTQRLKYLWSYVYFNNESAMPKNFAAMHRLRFA